MIDWIALILIYFLFLYKRWRTKGKRTFLINTLFYIYLSFVIYFTLMPFITSLPNAFTSSYQWMNMNAFDDVIYGRGDFYKQIILNIVMTIPFGFFMGIKKKTFLKATLLTILLSVTIELIQPFGVGRISDITDVITNTTGGIIGYYLYTLFKPMTKKRV